jgi:hypothetical protein
MELLSSLLAGLRMMNHFSADLILKMHNFATFRIAVRLLSGLKANTRSSWQSRFGVSNGVTR